MPRILHKQIQLFDAKGATGVSEAINVRDYRHIIIAISAAVNSSLTFKFQGSAMDTAPTFSGTQTVSNLWDYIHAYDLNNPAGGIVGDTGVALNNDTVANNTHLYEVNTDLLQWFSLELSAFTDGSLTAYLIAAND